MSKFQNIFNHSLGDVLMTRFMETESGFSRRTKGCLEEAERLVLLHCGQTIQELVSPLNQ